MAWTDIQSSGTCIDHSEWNAMVSDIQGHWNDSDIHFPSSNLIDWLNSVYQESGTATGGSGSGFTPHLYPQGYDITATGANKIYFSGQGGVYVYSGSNTIIISSQTGSQT